MKLFYMVDKTVSKPRYENFVMEYLVHSLATLQKKLRNVTKVEI